MSKIKEGVRAKLRFQTGKGILSVEGLYGLTIAELKEVGSQLESELNVKVSSRFNRTVSTKDKLKELAVDVLEEVYNDLVTENETAKATLETKAWNQKIMALKAANEEKKLLELSNEELDKLLK